MEKEDKIVNEKAKDVVGLLNKLKINPTTVIVSVNGALVTEDFKLKDSDEVSILAVISGG